MMYIDTLTGLAFCISGMCILALLAAPVRDVILWSLDHLMITVKRQGRRS